MSEAKAAAARRRGDGVEVTPVPAPDYGTPDGGAAAAAEPAVPAAGVPAALLGAAMGERPRIRDFIGSFTGWDEVAIANTFRRDFGDLPSGMTGRAAVFVLLRRRDGLKDGEAFKAAMDMTLKETNDLFAPMADVELPDDEEGSEGKG